MSLFEFTKKTKSAVLQIDSQNQIPINGFYLPVVIMPDNIKIDFRRLDNIDGLTKVKSININEDTVTIDGVTSTATTAKELYDSLEPLFFLDENSGADVMTKTEFNEIANTYAAFGYTQKTSASGLPILISGIVGIGSNNLTPPDSPQPVTGGNYNGYVKIEGFVQIAASESLTVSNSEIVIGQDGNYFSSHAYIDVSSSINTNTLGLVFCIERGSQLLFSTRPVGTRGFNGNNRTNLSGGGFLDNLENGDKISVWIGSEGTADISIYDCNVGINLRSKT